MYICGFNNRCIYTCPVSSGMRPRHNWFEQSDWKRFDFGGLVFSRSDVQPEKTHEGTRCKQAQRECAGKGSLLSLPQLTRTLSQAQQSFASLINHMNHSNTALAGNKFVLAAAKKFSMQEKPRFCTFIQRSKTKSLLQEWPHADVI